jgi:hypothetical protein
LPKLLITKLGDVARVEHRTRRVVRRVEHEQPRPRGHGGAHCRPIDSERLRIQRHVHRTAAGEVDGGLVAVVAGVEDDHLLARPNHGGDRIEDRLTGAGGHRDLGLWVRTMPVAAQGLVSDGFPQRRHAGHVRVLVLAFSHRAGERIAQRHRHLEIGETLPEVDRPVLGSEHAHDGEDGGADLRQLGVDPHRNALK